MSQYNLDDYKLLSKQLIALIPENCSKISVLANASALLKTFFTEKVNWVGFYLVENSSLILGPFQGLVATTNIDFDKGFCGLCATNKKTVRIENVHSDGLTTLHVPDMAAKGITGLTSNPIIIAILLNVILLVLGMIMDMSPIILIATPILLPIATSIGINPIQFGIMVILNCGIGLLTPPVGAVLFIGSAVAKEPMEKVVKATLPFYLCMIICLLLVTFVPQISMCIPNLFGK